mmetsp:Transcript_15081/g.48979  ORF Transcript_15081/g.48979 Transcript_15081/m.48979 type:complete len:1934 (+) Transcript_15081:83-5884(+)
MKLSLVLASVAVAGALDVRMGYFGFDPLPFMVGIGRGWYETGDATFHYYNHDSGPLLASKLDAGDLDIAVLGSAPFAEFAARGADLVCFYVQYVIKNQEALVVRESAIESPLQLAGKTLATSVGSTMHYHLKFLQEYVGGAGAFTIKDMSTKEVIQAYDDGDIDGAFYYGEAMKHILDNEGKTLVTSELLGSWGRPTFQLVAARGAFARAHPEVVARVANVMAALDESAKCQQEGAACPDGSERGASPWGAEDADGFLATIADVAFKPRDTVADRTASWTHFADFDLLSADDQIDCEFLALDEETCAAGATAGTARAAAHTADFHYSNKEVVAPAPRGRFLEAHADEFDYFETVVDATFLDPARWDRLAVDDLLEEGGPPFSDLRTGEPPSPCDGVRTFEGSGSFDDGAGGRDGLRYAKNATCDFVIAGATAESLVEVTFDRFRLWSGDVLRAWEGGDPQTGADGGARHLGTFSGYDVAAPPKLRGRGAISLRLSTTDTLAQAYGTAAGDGFAAVYDGDAPGCSDCSSRGACGADGFCVCDVGYFGADCERDACVGATLVDVDAAGGAAGFASAADALEAGSLYANHAECAWIFSTSSPALRVAVDFDVEEGVDVAAARAADLLRVYDAAAGARFGYARAAGDVDFVARDGEGTLEAVVDVGAGERVAVVFSSDGYGRRSGFRGTAVAADAKVGHACAADGNGCGLSSEGAVELRLASNATSRAPSRLVSNAPAMAYYTWSNAGAGKYRLVIEHLGLEPFVDAGDDGVDGDRLEIYADGVPRLDVSKISCKENRDCNLDDFMAEPAACVEGSCNVKRAFEFDVADRVDVVLRTDANDGDHSNLTGLVADLYAVGSCPDPDSTCSLNGGECRHGTCFVDEAAVDCACESGAPAGSYVGADNVFLKCPIGTHQPNPRNPSGLDSCQDCDEDEYADEEGSETCTRCPLRSTTRHEETALFGGAIGASSPYACVCVKGYYSRRWPVVDECMKCPAHAQCEGGLTQPYPDKYYWLPTIRNQDGEENKTKAYRCRYTYDCKGGNRAAECAIGFPERTGHFALPANLSCVAADKAYYNTDCKGGDQGSCLQSPEHNGHGWCGEGKNQRVPLCDDVKNAKKANDDSPGYFGLSTLAVRCPKPQALADLATVLEYCALFALFVYINDHVRPKYQVLDVILDTYQDLGIVSGYWLFWPASFDVLFMVFNIALFDVDVIEPKCSIAQWNQNATYFLMLAMPVIYCLFQFAWVAVCTPRRADDVTAAISQSASFLFGAQASLTLTVLEVFPCRRFVGMGEKVRAFAEDMPCGGSESTGMRVFGMFYMVIFVYGLPTCLFLYLVKLRRENRLCDPWTLERWGFCYDKFRPNAWLWGLVLRFRQGVLCFTSALLWHKPLAQGFVGIVALLVVIWAQATFEPYVYKELNQFEQGGLCLTIVTLAIGILFEAEKLGDDQHDGLNASSAASVRGALGGALNAALGTEHRVFVSLFFAIQALYLGLGLRNVYVNYKEVAARDRVLRALGRIIQRRGLARGASVHESDGREPGGAEAPRDGALADVDSFGHSALYAARAVEAGEHDEGVSLVEALARAVIPGRSRRRYSLGLNQYAVLREPLEELVAAFHGYKLANYVSSGDFQEASDVNARELCDLAVALSPFVADHSFTNNYSFSHEAAFYRRLEKFHPGLIDCVLEGSDARRADIARAIHVLMVEQVDRGTAVGRVGGVVRAKCVDRKDRSSVLFFLLHCSATNFGIAKRFFDGMVRATPKLAARSEAFREERAARHIQECFRRRRGAFRARPPAAGDARRPFTKHEDLVAEDRRLAERFRDHPLALVERRSRERLQRRGETKQHTLESLTEAVANRMTVLDRVLGAPWAGQPRPAPRYVRRGSAESASLSASARDLPRLGSGASTSRSESLASARDLLRGLSTSSADAQDAAYCGLYP